MKLKLTNTQIIELAQLLKKYGDVTEPWFAYTVARNLSSLNTVLEALDAAKKRTPLFDQYEKEREVLLQKYAHKDTTGKPSMKTVDQGGGVTLQVYDIDDTQALQVDVDALLAQDKYKDVLQKEALREREFQELLLSSTELDLYPIKMSKAPEGIITANDMSILFSCSILLWDLEEVVADK